MISVTTIGDHAEKLANEERVGDFNNFAGGGGGLRTFGGGLDEKGVVNFWKFRFRFFREYKYKFYLVTLISVAIYEQIKRCCITYVFSVFHFIKSFFTSVLLIAYLRSD